MFFVALVMTAAIGATGLAADRESFMADVARLSRLRGLDEQALLIAGAPGASPVMCIAALKDTQDSMISTKLAELLCYQEMAERSATHTATVQGMVEFDHVFDGTQDIYVFVFQVAGDPERTSESRLEGLIASAIDERSWRDRPGVHRQAGLGEHNAPQR